MQFFMRFLKLRNLIVLLVSCSGHLFLYAAQVNMPTEQATMNKQLQLLLEEGGEDILFEEVQKFIAEGTNVTGETAEGDTALMLAIKNENPRIAKLLIETIKKNHGNKVLYDYINRRTPYTEEESSGYTALALTADTGDLATAQLILENGAEDSLEESTAIGDTPLMGAVLNNHLEIAELFLDYGAQINARDNYGHTALMYAAENHRIPLIKLLLEHGADDTLQDDKERTAYDYAQGNPATQKIFMDHYKAKIKADYAAKLKIAQAEQPIIKQALEEHMIPPLSDITTAYMMPHEEEERAAFQAQERAKKR